jgi:hypothetical protein
MIWSQYNHFPSPRVLEGRSLDFLNIEPVVASEEVFQPTLAWVTPTGSHMLWVRIFDDGGGDTRWSLRLVFFIEQGHFLTR